jgi:mRNA-degrading endonuclease RelE of RelBE toxin-antitoxin system
MMRIVYDPLFLKQVRDLPRAQQQKLARLIAILRDNPYDPRLHTKKLGPPLEGQFSFRITRDWRAIFRFSAPTDIFIMRVKHRKDIYR